MATYVLIPGAGGDSEYWYRVVPELQARGHEVVAPDLPCDDDSAGLPEYTDVVVDAVGARTGVVVVAQSLGAFTAPLVCERVPADLLVLVAPMIPAPGESAGQWWDNTGHAQAKREQDEREGRDPDAEFDPVTVFLHDLPPEVLSTAMSKPPKDQSDKVFGQPWPLSAWPDVPTRVLLCRQDRFFPAEFQRRLAQERLGLVPDELDSGHLPALSSPVKLVDHLERYRGELV